MCMGRSKVKSDGTGDRTLLVARGYVAHCLYGLSLATGGTLRQTTLCLD